MATEYNLGKVVGPTGPAGPEGKTGPTGQQGPAGAAATVDVGAVATGEPGTQAAVENAGTANAAVLNFTIPKGEKGETGATGPKGETGAIGPMGPQGPAGKDGKSAESVTYTATLSTSWSGSGPYTQTVSVAGILASDNPVADVVLSDTASTAQAQLEAWGCVGRITTAAGSITATCYEEKPTTALTVQMKVVR